MMLYHQFQHTRIILEDVNYEESINNSVVNNYAPFDADSRCGSRHAGQCRKPPFTVSAKQVERTVRGYRSQQSGDRGGRGER